MSEKIKNISFPALLLLVVAVFKIGPLLSFLRSLFNGLLGFSSILSLINILCPFVLFYFLFMKENKQKALGGFAVFFGCASIVSGLLRVRTLFLFGYTFIEAIVEGPLYNILAPVLIGILMLLLGLKFIKNQTVTKNYYLLCGVSIFLVAFGSVLMAIANPYAILSNVPTLLHAIALWYIPKLYIPQEYQKTRTTQKKVITIVAVVAAMYLLLAVSGGLSGSSSNEPWRELGVSKKEYMDVYAYYKYGVHP